MQNMINPNVFNGIQMSADIEPMRNGKASSWLGEYHWVQLAITEENKYQDITSPAIEWCKEHFGRSGVRWFEKKGKFYFKEEKDMTVFILRWS